MERLLYEGKIPFYSAKEVVFSRLGIGFEKLDRDVFDPNKAYDKVSAIGVKKIRLQSGWMRTEKQKGVYDFAWLDEIVDRYGEPPRGVLNLVDIALLRAKAKECAITDIRQKQGEIWFTLAELNFDAVGKICSDADYQKRVQFVASAKVPTLRLKLTPKLDSLKQSKVFVEKFRQLTQA